MTVELFMLMSIDGKISTGAGMDFDFDKDFVNDNYLCVGLPAYYAEEKKTATVSIISGKTVRKLGVNEGKWPNSYVSVNFVIVDNDGRLTREGIKSVLSKCDSLTIATTAVGYYEYIAKGLSNCNVFSICYEDWVDKLLNFVYDSYGVDYVTLQGGGDLNRAFVDAGVVNVVNVFIAPTIVGGHDTPTLVGGHGNEELNLHNFKLTKCTEHQGSYVQLVYKSVV